MHTQLTTLHFTIDEPVIMHCHELNILNHTFFFSFTFTKCCFLVQHPFGWGYAIYFVALGYDRVVTKNLALLLWWLWEGTTRHLQEGPAVFFWLDWGSGCWDPQYSALLITAAAVCLTTRMRLLAGSHCELCQLCFLLLYSLWKASRCPVCTSVWMLCLTSVAWNSYMQRFFFLHSRQVLFPLFIQNIFKWVSIVSGVVILWFGL